MYAFTREWLHTHLKNTNWYIHFFQAYQRKRNGESERLATLSRQWPYNDIVFSQSWFDMKLWRYFTGESVCVFLCTWGVGFGWDSFLLSRPHMALIFMLRSFWYGFYKTNHFLMSSILPHPPLHSSLHLSQQHISKSPRRGGSNNKSTRKSTKLRSFFSHYLDTDLRL